MSHKLKAMHTPIFWAEGHPGPLSREGWTLEVGGLVEHPTTLTFEEILAMPKRIVPARLTSVTRWSVFGHWGGLHLDALLARVGAKPEAAYVRFFSYRLIYTTTVPLEIARREHSLLAYEFDGEPLTSDYGGPIRGFIPYLWGYKSAKSIVRLELVEYPIPGYWEERGYSDEARILPSLIHDVNTHRWRRIRGGDEVVEFLD